MTRLSQSMKGLPALTAILVYCGVFSMVHADQPVGTERHPGWHRQEVHLRAGAGRQIRAIRYPDDQRSAELLQQADRKGVTQQTLPLSTAPSGEITMNAEPTTILVNTIDSPPLAGFVPWVSIALTNSRNDELEMEAVLRSFLTGSPLHGNLATNYAIGVFDTGASSNVMGYTDGVRAGIFGTPDYLTSSTVQLLGAGGGEVDAWVSQPLGVFVDGLSTIEPNTPGPTMKLSGVLGETNTSIIVGQGDPEFPDIATAIGVPLSLYYAASIDNSHRITVMRDGKVYHGPPVELYTLSNPATPNYSSQMTLQLRPMDAYFMMYFPNLYVDPLDPDWGEPMYPTMTFGADLLPTQSLFFVGGVSMSMGSEEFSFSNNNGFLFDTGAQITVVSQLIAGILGFNTNNPDFEVEIQDVTGAVIYAPGFYVNSVAINATGEVNRLRYTHVPVVQLDIMSPEGGFLDGIIGMNLFTQYNMVFRGGGFTEVPVVEFEALPNRLAADVAPAAGDGVVDILDLSAFIQSFLAPVGSAQWNWRCDLASPDEPDYRINLLDFAVLAEQWLQTLQ
jgi:hypothetical protein